MADTIASDRGFLRRAPISYGLTMASLYAQRELTLRPWLTSLLGHPGGDSVNHPNVATCACYLFAGPNDPQPTNRPRPNANDHHSGTQKVTRNGKDLTQLEQEIISSPWCAANAHEPLCEGILSHGSTKSPMPMPLHQFKYVDDYIISMFHHCL